MMKHILLVFALSIVIAGITPAAAQDPQIEIVPHIIAEPPSGYVNTYSQVEWSPHESFVAVSFDDLDDRQISRFTHWQLYNVETSDMLMQFGGLINWYADDIHVLIQYNSRYPPVIFNARTSLVEGRLENAGTMFADSPIKTIIANLDDTNTLRLYDAQTGAIRLTVENVADVPQFSPDDLWLAVNVIGSGIEVYNTTDLNVEYTLGGFQIEKWSPDSRQMSVIPLDSAHKLLGPHHIWTLDYGLSAPIYNITDKLIWSPDGSRIAAIIDYQKVRIYHSQSGHLITTLWGYPSGPSQVKSWQANYFIVASGDHGFLLPPVVTIWDTATWERVYQEIVDFPNYWFEGDTLHIHETFQGIRKIDLQTGQVIEEMPFESMMPFISPDHEWVIGRIASAENSANMALSVLHISTQHLVTVALPDGTSPSTIRWSPDSTHFASINRPESVTIWEIVDGSE